MSDATTHQLRDTLNRFAGEWSSHGRKVQSDYQILENKILILAAHIEQGEISGCGIDKSLHLLDEYASQNGFGWVSALDVVFRDEQLHWQVVPRTSFRQLVKQGAVSASTIVLDSTISTVDELRNGQLEKPLSDSWHARVFRIPSDSTVA